MTQRVLTRAEIAEITSRQNSSINVARWPSHKDKELLFKAAENREKLVKFSDGTIYKIRYSEGMPWTYGSNKDEKHSTIFVSRMDGVVAPCGWFSYAGLRKDLFK